MNRSRFVRIRTDTFLSLVKNEPCDTDLYLKAVGEFYEEGAEHESEDNMVMGMIDHSYSAPYSMRDLDKPSRLTSLDLPESYSDFITAQKKFSTTYAQDWPQANDDNQFGKRHPFSWELPTNPMLQGAQWGEPAFVDHLLHLIEEDEDGQTILKSMQDAERMGYIPKEFEDVMGRPTESLHQLFHNDRYGRHDYKTSDEYIEHKREEWAGNGRLGLLSYLFGLEWQSPEQRELFMGALKKMGGTEDEQHPDARKVRNDFSAVAGLSWDRAMRNWFERFIPMARWWSRPSDRHGPVSAEDMPSGLTHVKSPYIKKELGMDEAPHGEEVISPSATFHNWLPFQHWGGVGRDEKSLIELLKQSYPAAFSGWLGDKLVGFLEDREHPLNDPADAYHSSGSSFFPKTANHPQIKEHPHRSAIATGWEAGSEHPRTRSINRRRGMWSSIANGHHNPPSDVMGRGPRTIIPERAFASQRLGQVVNTMSDQGQPRSANAVRERHPGDEEFHTYHNDHFQKTDNHVGGIMSEMAQQLMTKHGPGLFQSPNPTDIRANTIARGNMQQLAQAANMHLMRGNNPDLKTMAPQFVANGLASQEVPLGAVHPHSHATMPPTYLSGDKDAWGHEMPATLAWNWDRKQNGINFDVKDKPFTTLQKTAHEGHIHSVNPTHLDKPIQEFGNPVPALGSLNAEGRSPLLSQDLWKSDDDYEPTGVFKTAPNPAHTIYDLTSVDDLKGFTGNWVVQKQPKGKRMFVVKKGGHISAHDHKGRDVTLPSNVRKSVRSQSGDCTFDGVLKDDEYRAIDLLVHKGDDIHMEPLEDRLSILRTVYETDSHITFPMPADCKFTDREGLRKNIDVMGGSIWLRDATSTFMKEKENHHKWVLYTPNGDDLTKMNGPYPSPSYHNGNIVLEYPGHTHPVVVKSTFDEDTYAAESIEPQNPLSIHAEKQFQLWGPVAAHLMKYDISEITPYPPTITNLGSMLFVRAPLLGTDGGESESQHALVAARQLLMDADNSMTSEELKGKVTGLDDSMLDELGGEYGLERTESDEWTVNEALDNEIVERQGSPLARISGNIQGGVPSGMLDMITTPRGPTELTDEEATPMFDPYQREGGEMPEMPMHIRIQTKDGQGEDIDGELEVEGNRATLRYPQKTPREAQEEEEVVVPIEEEPEPPMPGPMPPPQPSG